MKKQDLDYLESKTKELRATTTKMADGGSHEELWRIIHNPGFTSVAEGALIVAIMDAVVAHANTTLTLHQALLSAAAKVELNPQPLPP
jgi:hypothetical protein